jgi:hypothetical protein
MFLRLHGTTQLPLKFDVCTVHCWVMHRKNQHCALGIVNLFKYIDDPQCTVLVLFYAYPTELF